MRLFSKADTTNWSIKLDEITEIINGTIPSYCTDDLPQRFKEASLKKTKLTFKENKTVMKALKIN